MPELRPGFSHQGVLLLDSSERLWKRADAGSPVKKLSVFRTARELVSGVHEQISDHPGGAISDFQDGDFVALREIVDFLSELLPLSSKTTASTVRNRMMKVGARLQKHAEALAAPSTSEPSKQAVIGLDGGYVRARHRRPERNFEVVAGKVLSDEGSTTRFAFVRNGGSAGEDAASFAMRRSGVGETTAVTVLTDGDAGLRMIHRRIAPEAEHVLDWFHVGMRFEKLKQVAKGINGLMDGAIRGHALAELRESEMAVLDGYTKKEIIGLAHLGQWARARSFDRIPSMKKLSHALLDVIRYLELSADSMPDYGDRYRDGCRISTGFAESAVNEIIAKRMAKSQQMRWNRYTVHRFLDVRIHVLNETLEDAFRYWHRGFRPIAERTEVRACG